MMSEENKYEDIINLPHHVSSTRPKMSMRDRAAQFSPFAALTGYEDDVLEAARITCEKTELSEDAKSLLNAKLQTVYELIKNQPEITVTYFVPDTKKSGGEYVLKTGRAVDIDEYKRRLVLSDEILIPIDDIIEIEGAMFET